YPLIIRENEYSNAVALKGFTEAEINMLTDALKKVKENIADDWLYVKKGNKRSY
ncbi:MarR family transcriptional regulator, partial [Listeria monocytogenes]|nr:MarR family transcriptional regulator [Listeria monocytogenes]EAG7217183.1 MarR family transcriptional regulator [Listeria monocytogenes]EDN7837387.1 MarR family transcriptional regulator [Listeria monocytogenes]EFQ8092351.1 MarR family transcriptional regulator [Listeria monocytogenes]EGP7149463.1 MarR family transcriptional regulator [Listeria monocytogenes]